MLVIVSMKKLFVYGKPTVMGPSAAAVSKVKVTPLAVSTKVSTVPEMVAVKVFTGLRLSATVSAEASKKFSKFKVCKIFCDGLPSRASTHVRESFEGAGIDRKSVV